MRRLPSADRTAGNSKWVTTTQEPNGAGQGFTGRERAPQNRRHETAYLVGAVLASYSRGPVGDFEISSTIAPTDFSFALDATSACASTPTSRSFASTTGSRRT